MDWPRIIVRGLSSWLNLTLHARRVVTMTTQIREPFGEPVGESATEPLSGAPSPTPQAQNSGYEWPASAEARLLEALMQLGERDNNWNPVTATPGCDWCGECEWCDALGRDA